MTTATLENPIARYKQLDAEQFDIQHDVPVFSEHVDYEGTRYDRAVLASICRNMNSRIKDTGDYTAICVGHTPNPEERAKGMRAPEVVGYAGPYDLGLIGTENPRWAIIARSWAIYKTDVDRCRRYARRSVEVYREPNPHDRYFDPIALLGAEMPRLDLGLAYSRLKHDQKVARYAVTAPAGGNVFVPAFGTDEEPERYEAEEPRMLAEEEIKQIVGAIESMDVWQWCKSKMEEELSKGDPTAPDGEAAMPGEAAADVEAPVAPPADPPVDPAAPPAAPPADEVDDKKPDADRYRRERDTIKARYAKLEAENTVLKSQVEKIAVEKRQAERYSRLNELQQTHILDIEEEQGRSASMTDSQFDAHCELIVNRYQRNLVGARLLPMGKPEKLEPEDAKKAERAKKVLEKFNRYQRDGKYKTWDEVAAEIDAA